MQIVGSGLSEADETHVHTIDVWFSQRLNRYVVERLDENGDLVGSPHHCQSEAEAVVCVSEWMRAHPETQHVAPKSDQRAARVQRHARRRAA